jgi:hypothetical protein
MSRWFYTLDNRQRLGPVTVEQLRALAASGTIRLECMVMPEGGGKWVQANTVKGLFQKPMPASPPIAKLLFLCPKCGRSIPLQQHELSFTIECSQCGARFVPPQAAAQVSVSSIPQDDPALLGLVKDDPKPVKQTTEPVGSARITIPRGPRILLPAIITGVVVLCAVIGIGIFGANSDQGATRETTAAEPGIAAQAELVMIGVLYECYMTDEATADGKYLNKRLQFQVSTGWSGVEKNRDGKYFAWVSMDADTNRHLILQFRTAEQAAEFRRSSGLICGTCTGRVGSVEAALGHDMVSGRAFSRGRLPVIVFKDCELVK